MTDDVASKIEELRQLQAKVRNWRALTIVAVISIVVVCIGMVLHQAHLLGKDGPEQREFVEELSSGLQADVLPDVQRLANQTANEIVPALRVELQKMADRMPELIDAGRKELETMGKNLQAKSEKTFDTTFGEMVKASEVKLRQTYPDVNEKEVQALVNNLTTVGKERMAHISENLFAEHIGALHTIIDHMEAIHKAEAPHINNQTPTWEMALLMFDLFRDDLGDQAPVQDLKVNTKTK